MSLTTLEFAKEELVPSPYLSYRGEQVYSDWEDEDDDDAGWSFRSHVEEEDEERPTEILEIKAAA
jgi:hypothetical protein